MSEGRLPAHLEISGWIRGVEANGGFAMVLARGERDGGTILILTVNSGRNTALWERMPQLDGARPFTCTRRQDPEKPDEIKDYVVRRRAQDPDIWVLEIDHDEAEGLIGTIVN